MLKFDSLDKTHKNYIISLVRAFRDNHAQSIRIDDRRRAHNLRSVYFAEKHGLVETKIVEVDKQSTYLAARPTKEGWSFFMNPRLPGDYIK